MSTNARGCSSNRPSKTFLQLDPSLELYFSDLRKRDAARHDVVIELAAEFRAAQLALWREALAQPELVALVSRIAADQLPSGSPGLQRMLRSLRPNKPTEQAEARHNARAQRAADRLCDLDSDRRCLAALLDGLQRGQVSNIIDEARLVRLRGYAARVSNSRSRLIEVNLRLVVAIARRYQKQGMSLADLIQEGNLGLVKAVNRFDHRRGVRFSTYGSWWIRHCIIRASTEKEATVRVPVHVLESRRRIRKVRKELTARLGRLPDDAELSRAAELPAARFAAARDLGNPILFSLDQTDAERASAELQLESAVCAAMADDKPSPPEWVARHGELRALDELLGQLDSRQAIVLRKRFGIDGDGRSWTLAEVAHSLGLSRERVRQIERHSISLLRKRMGRRGLLS